MSGQQRSSPGRLEFYFEFASPTFIYGQEMVWGNDRMDLLEEIISEGSRAGL